jgi:FimV-like protein
MMCLLLLVSSITVTTLNADTRYRVKASDSLQRIVQEAYPNSALSKQQLMIAIFIRNPKAFRKGNINFLMRGQRLVLPSEENLEIVSHKDAKAILKQGTKAFQREILGNRGEVLTDFELSDLSREDLEILSGEQPEEGFVDQQDTQGNEQETQGEPAPEQAAEPVVVARKSIRKKQQKRTRKESKAIKALAKSRKKLSLAQKKLRKIENEREQLRAQLNKLKNEKKQADQKLLTLEEKLKQSKQQAQIQKAIQLANVEIKKQEAKTQEAKETANDRGKTLPQDVIAGDSQKRDSEETLKVRIENLKNTNAELQKKLQETPGGLAENRHENIGMSRKLDTLKQKSPTLNKPTENHSVAEQIGSAQYSEKTLDSADMSTKGAVGTGMGKLFWLFAVLAFFAALWFLLRRFLKTDQGGVSSAGGEVYATPAFESTDDLDADYEEASLETSIKLDVARAYLEADDRKSAFEMLQEVIDEGDEQQQQEARDIMASHPD